MASDPSWDTTTLPGGLWPRTPLPGPHVRAQKRGTQREPPPILPRLPEARQACVCPVRSSTQAQPQTESAGRGQQGLCAGTVLTTQRPLSVSAFGAPSWQGDLQGGGGRLPALGPPRHPRSAPPLQGNVSKPHDPVTPDLRPAGGLPCTHPDRRGWASRPRLRAAACRALQGHGPSSPHTQTVPTFTCAGDSVRHREGAFVRKPRRRRNSREGAASRGGCSLTERGDSVLDPRSCLTMRPPPGTVDTAGVGRSGRSTAGTGHGGAGRRAGACGGRRSGRPCGVPQPLAPGADACAPRPSPPGSEHCQDPLADGTPRLLTEAEKSGVSKFSKDGARRSVKPAERLRDSRPVAPGHLVPFAPTGDPRHSPDGSDAGL